MSKKPKDPEPKTAAVHESDRDRDHVKEPVEDHAKDDVAEKSGAVKTAARAEQGAELFMRVYPSLDHVAPATPAGMRAFATESVAGSDRVPAGFRRGRVWA